MTCPKCHAKIGIMKLEYAIETGPICGESCFICGFWIQEYPMLRKIQAAK